MGGTQSFNRVDMIANQEQSTDLMQGHFSIVILNISYLFQSELARSTVPSKIHQILLTA